MKAEFKMEPFPHVLLKDFYTEGDMRVVMQEKTRLDPILQPPNATGSATHRGTGRPLKYNS